jgi:hypothetical protein
MSTAPKNAGQSQNWSLNDVVVSFDSHWWGFTIHLNEAATQLLGQIDEWATKLIAAFGDELEGVGEIIVGYIKLRQAVIQAEDQGNGVQLVSPWPMPTLLVPLPDPLHVDDSQLRWTTTDGQNGWVAEQKMDSAFSETGPALAVFQDKLYCVYKGGGSNNHIYFMCFDGSWTTPTIIPDVYTTDTPALAVSPDSSKLCCVYKGDGNDHLYWMCFDGDSWTTSGSPIPSADSQSGPALALYQNKLRCVFRGGGSNNNIYYVDSYDGTNWSGPNRIPNVATDSGPALAVLQARLCCVYKGNGNQHLYWMYFDGDNWTTSGTPITSADSQSGPALAAFQDTLYCLYRGANDNEHLYHMESSDGTNWNASGFNWIPDVNSYYQPGLAVYRHPLGTKDQLLCVHRGVKD